MSYHKSLTSLSEDGPKSSRLECIIKHQFSYFSTETYVVGTQKNRLDEMVLLSTQSYMFILAEKKKYTILVSKVGLSGPMVDWLQSLKQFFINVSYDILVASLTLMALF